MVGLALGAAHRVPRRPARADGDRASACATAVRAAARAIRPSSATRSATRSRRRSCAGTAAARIERFLAAPVPRGQATRTRRRWSPTSTTRRPSTCGLPFLDFCLLQRLPGDARAASSATSARLQNLAGDRPLLMAEIGLDSRRNGERRAGAVARLAGRDGVRRPGCAGAFVFAWTDEWHRGGYDDRRLGLRPDRPRPRAEARARGGRARRSPSAPFAPARAWPRGLRGGLHATTARRRCASASKGCSALDYPDYEVIVVDDGSTDDTAEIARDFEACGVIETENRGLSSAPATPGIAGGDRRDRRLHRRRRLSRPALADATSPPRSRRRATPAVGGPNIPPPGDGRVAECVAQRAGRADARADLRPRGRAHPRLQHGVPQRGAARRSAASTRSSARPATTSTSAGGCRRRAGRIGFSPGAVVWHHRRRTVRALPAPAARLRQGRGAARAQVARRSTAPPATSPGTGGCTATARAQHRGGWRWHVYYGGWGNGLLPAALRPAQRAARVAAADARVVPGDLGARRALRRSGSSGRRR